MINFFNLDEKLMSFLDKINLSQYISKEHKEESLLELQPNEIVDNYFKYIRNGNDEQATKLFSNEADKNLQTGTIKEYNKIITDVYYGVKTDIPTYPLFEEIRNFNYNITAVDIDENAGVAKVNIEIENCDITLLVSLLLQADSEERAIDKMSDLELKKLFENAVSQYKNECLINTNATFVLKKGDYGNWEIDSITPLKDFSTVVIGQAHDLILFLDGDNVDGTSNYKNDNYYPNFEDDPYAKSLLP